MSALDYHLQHVLKKLISHGGEEVRLQLKNVARCGQSIIHAGIGTTDAVYVLKSSSGEAKLFGHAHCRNPHCCPVCSATIMEEYRAKIASAIDMLSHEGKFGFMATFTIPHLKFMTCRETTDILYETWKYFRTRVKSTHKNSTWVHPFDEFCAATDMDTWVRVCEYTFGEKNGWHPHFHCVFWVPNDKADIVLDYEQKLCEFWIQQARRVTLKLWKQKHLHEGEDLDKLLADVFKRADWWGQALKFSRDTDGKLMRATSSDYIAGWAADRETTGNRRKQASHEGHFTPYQILELAEHDNHWANRYLEFCMAVTRKPVHHRMNFSKNGICKRITEWQAEHGYSSAIAQKKSTWAVVGYFDKQSWWKICLANRRAPVIANIIHLVSMGNSDLVAEYTHSIDVEFRRRGTHKCFDDIAEVVELIFNG